jgi:hypothetical protein
VAYGPEGWGKSTFAAAWPAPLFLDVENSTQSMDVARTPRPSSWAGLTAIVADLAHGAAGYKTVVLDTADWAERLCREAICARANVKAIGDVDYGRLYQQLAGEWATFLDTLTRMQDATGCHVLLLAHSCLAHVDIPEESGTVDRYEMKLTHSFKVDLSALTKEWATLVLHLGYETLVVKVDGTHKAQGGTKRVMHTTHHACWDAKQRPGYDLPDSIECPKDNPAAGLAKLWAGQASPAAPARAAAPAPATPAPATAPAPEPVDAERTVLLCQLGDLLASGDVTFAQLGAELARKGVVPADTPVEAYNLPTLRRVLAGWSAITTNIRNQEKKA